MRICFFHLRVSRGGRNVLIQFQPSPCFFTPLKSMIRNRKIRHFNVETNEWEDLSRASDSFNQLAGESEATGSRLSQTGRKQISFFFYKANNTALIYSNKCNQNSSRTTVTSCPVPLQLASCQHRQSVIE